MNFDISGSSLGFGGVMLLMIVVVLGFGIIHYNNYTRPQEERELADEREAERREHEAAHEYDVSS